MKIALLGKGKTGGKVLELLIEKKIPHTVFDSNNKCTLAKLAGHDVVISFLTGEVFEHYLELLLESKLPVVTGSTGLDYQKAMGGQFLRQCQSGKAPWVYANNFSLGMNLVYQMILIMKEAGKIFSDYEFNMHEIHHTKKLDAPSGTALSWKKWSEHEMTITSERTGDVIGIHELTLTTSTEKIFLKHEALDRKIFAEGALWAASMIHELSPGFYQFQDIVQNKLLNNKTK